MDPGIWKVTSQYIDGVWMYAIFRLRDINKEDNPSNREYANIYSESRAEMLDMADQMNAPNFLY